MKNATLQLETLACPSCLQKIENALKGLDGVQPESLRVLFNSSKVKLSFDAEKTSINEIEETITKLGYKVLKSNVKD
jgi:copper chaperone CopZ